LVSNERIATTYTPDIRHFLGKSMRHGTATYAELREIGAQYGPGFADTLAEELNTAGVRLIDEKDILITPETNVLMNGLRLVDLVSLALQLPVVPKVPRRLHAAVLGQRSVELDLRRLEYLDVDQEWYYLSSELNRLQRAIRRLFDSGHIPFAREWRNKRENIAYLRSLMAHPSFSQKIRPEIREHYLSIREVGLFVRWIQATGKRAPAMAEIIRSGLDEHGVVSVRSVLFSSQASTAGGALKSRRDVCFSCPPDMRCLPLQNVDDPYNVLLEYRYADLDGLLSVRYPGQAFEDCMVKDWTIAKFFLPYTIVVTAKRWMIEIELLNSSNAFLDKSHGEYCPKNDIWELARPG
jgi:hypothetical protein